MMNRTSIVLTISLVTLITHAMPSEAGTQANPKKKKGTLITLKTQSFQKKVCTNPVSADPDIDPSSTVLLTQGEIKILNQDNSNLKTLDFTLTAETFLYQPVQPGTQAPGFHITYEPWTWKNPEGETFTIENHCFTPNEKDLDCFKKQFDEILKSNLITDHLENPSGSPLRNFAITYLPGLAEDEKNQELQGFKKKWVIQKGGVFITFGEDKSGKCVLSTL